MAQAPRRSERPDIHRHRASRAPEKGVIVNRRWSEQDTTDLRALYGTVPAPVLAQVFGRTANQIHQKARVLGLCWREAWGEEEELQLRRLHRTVPLAVIARVIGRSLKAIEKKVTVLGLGAGRSAGQGAGRHWTATDIETLRRLYPTKSTQELSAVLDRTEVSIANCASKLGLTKAPEYFACHGNPSLRWRAMSKEWQEIFLLTKKLERKLDEREQHSNAA